VDPPRDCGPTHHRSLTQVALVSQYSVNLTDLSGRLSGRVECDLDKRQVTAALGGR